MQTFPTRAKALPDYEVIVCGGGMAGVCAAVQAARRGAKTLLVEPMGCLGGTLTQGLVPQVLDADNKGGLVRELYQALDAQGMTCPRTGPRLDASGRRLPGRLVDVEGSKVALETLCREAGVEVLLYSRLADVVCERGRIARALLSTEAGNLQVAGRIFIDATGNGMLASLCGCEGETGTPDTGTPQPASMSVQVVGLPETFDDTSDAEAKSAYGDLLARHGIAISGTQAAVMKLPALLAWLMSVNFEYDVWPEDIRALTRATMDGRRECVQAVRAHAGIPGYERLWAVSGCEHIGLREGRRIRGQYRLTLEDILSGARFDDAICTVRFNIDIHKLRPNDTVSTHRGYRTQPYHIPYRCLLPLGVENLLLAGRLISGDFYAHASYRVMGNMAATGEAAGYAAAACVRRDLSPSRVEGAEVRRFMESLGYEIL